MEKISIMIAEDQTMFREGIVAVLNNLKNLKVVAEAENGRVLLDKIKIQQPDIVLLDLKMPVMDGPETLKYIKKDYPAVKVIALTMHDDDDFIFEMVESGVNSYLLKDTRIKQLEETIKMVMKNEFYYNEHVREVLKRRILSKKRNVTKMIPTISFSEQELEVLNLICKEYSNSEIGEELYLSARTIEGYKRRLQHKVGAKSLAGLIVYAIKNGLTD